MAWSNFIITFYSIGLLLSVATLAENVSPQAPEIRLLMGSETPVKMNYETDLISLALERSKAKYGDYTFSVLETHMSHMRGFRTLTSDFGQITTTTIPHEKFVSEGVVRLPHPFYDGLLGYRQCIIRKQDAQKFSRITDVNHLKAIRIGQGSSWQDVVFFEDNGFTVVKAEKFDALIPMLSSSRFDCLSLGILEAEAVLNERKDQYPDLMIAPNLVIFYPLDVYAYTSKARPDIQERMNYGMEVAQLDGSARALFFKYFSKELKFLKNSQLRLFSPIPMHELPPNEPSLIR